MPHLSKSNRVICIDLLGHGQTECLGYIHTMEEMADAVAAVLQQLKIRRSVFIGHSMAGMWRSLSRKHIQMLSRDCVY